jgi:protein-S-isoprenylcysteine O-methyltransferase Ste14
MKQIGLSRTRSIVLARVMPATSLFILLLWQMAVLVHMGSLVIHHPSSADVIGFLRGGLYAVFLSIPVAVFLLQDPPAAQDDRLLVRAAALIATFLLILLGILAPSGPRLISVSVRVEMAALVATVLGAAFAVAAMIKLGMSFSFRPEARKLVTNGPYRVIRHPVYLAEIVMSCGVLIASMRLTLVLGESIVIALQVVRIRAEERLLDRTLPAFKEFESATRYRLIPGLW